MLTIYSQQVVANMAVSPLLSKIKNKEPSSEISSKIIKIENTRTPYMTTLTTSIKLKTTSLFNFIMVKYNQQKKCDRYESSHLVGLTISPEIASKFDREIEFNGTGKIKCVKKNSINRKNYHVLINNRIKPLNETPQRLGRCIRTPGEVIINIGRLISESGERLKNRRELEERIKSTWLDGALSRQSLYNTVELIKIKLSNYPTLLKDIDSIMQTLEKDFFITKRNDNYYGRLFETELSEFVFNHPSDDIIRVRDAVCSFIFEDFFSHSKDYQSVLCVKIARIMSIDPAIWRYSLSGANIFIKNKTPESFIDMMTYSGDYSIPLILSVVVKYIILSQGTIELKNEATRYYISKIVPQRQTVGLSRDQKDLVTAAKGLLLPHQKKFPFKNELPLGYGIRPIDKYVRPTMGIALNDHDTVALSSERVVGIGMSGSANVLHFLFLKLQLRDAKFPMDEAKLATASWLCFSGGHSFNEAYSVFGFMSQGNFKPLSFNQLKSSSLLSEIAITHAYNKVIEASVALSSCHGDKKNCPEEALEMAITYRAETASTVTTRIRPALWPDSSPSVAISNKLPPATVRREENAFPVNLELLL